jgi:hypothetical protein
MKLQTAKQVAEKISVSQQTITRNAIRHSIGKKIGVQWVFTDEDVAALTDVIAGNSNRDFSAMGKAGMASRWKPKKRRRKKNE